MSLEVASQGAAIDRQPRSIAAPRRLWPALFLVGLYWSAVLAFRSVEAPFFFRFLFGMAAPFLLFVSFNVWWWSRRWLSLADRFLGLVLVVGGPIATAWLTHRSLGMATMLMSGIPVLLSVLTLWMFLIRKAPLPQPRLATLAVALVTLGSFTLFRVEGLNGDLQPSLHWRWSPTAEEQFLAAGATSKSADVQTNSASAPQSPPLLVAGDWPAFRGPSGDGRIPGATIDPDWSAHPPRLVWKQRIGPAWSSAIVIGERLYTQEQRGEKEAVNCYEASTGRQLWVHEDEARFWESVSGTGPRATPTFSNGRIYTVGATGLVNCLDAATGEPHWAVDLKSQASAEIPGWGLSCSPLVTGGLVVVYGGGEGHNNLLAYDAESGKPAWSAAAGGSSYASPQLVTLDGQPQILMHHDHGLTAVDPITGAELWHGGVAMPGAPLSLQIHVISPTQLLAGSLTGMGVGSIEISNGSGQWTITDRWSTTQIKPEFSDFVVHHGYAYGFDGAIFCCLDVATGKRAWKAGRYGRGQVVLLPDQDLLLVVSESGEVILLTATPDKHQELARMKALSGKTWNHPVLAHGRLYVRNAEEMACYELQLAGAR